MESKEYLQKQNRKTKVRQTRRTLSKTLMYLMIAVIWLHSVMPPTISSAESGFFYEYLFPFLTKLVGSEHATELLVRKLGHFGEYAVLGMFVWHNVNQSSRGKHLEELNRFNVTVCNCAVIAFLDETIQIFSGRGPMVTDIWIDIFGAAFGTILFRVMVFLFVGVLKKRRGK